MLLPAKDGGFVYGRTLEFGLDLNSQLIVVPRNITSLAVMAAMAFGMLGYFWVKGWIGGRWRRRGRSREPD
jgi:hypothetical protein